MVQDEIARASGLVRDGKVGGLLKPRRIEPGFRGRFVLPHRIRIIDRRPAVGTVRLRCGPGWRGDKQKHNDWQTSGHGLPPAQYAIFTGKWLMPIFLCYCRYVDPVSFGDRIDIWTLRRRDGP